MNWAFMGHKRRNYFFEGWNHLDLLTFLSITISKISKISWSNLEKMAKNPYFGDKNQNNLETFLIRIGICHFSTFIEG